MKKTKSLKRLLAAFFKRINRFLFRHRPRPDLPLAEANWKFQLIPGTPEWRREYSGKIEPLSDYRFFLRCDNLTGRKGLKRSSRFVTHLFSGGWCVGDKVFLLPEREGFRFSQHQAWLILDVFALWWIRSIELGEPVDTLIWSPGQFGLWEPGG